MSGARYRRFLGALPLLTLALLLINCGGGVDSGGTGAPASFAGGQITGFGSIIVNGIHYDESNAQILDSQSVPHSASDLKLGMTVEVQGSVVATGSSGASAAMATTVRYISAIIGPIDSVSTTPRSLSALGQPVRISPKTVFDAAITGGIAGLKPGDIVEIFGQLDPGRTRYTATRVQRRNDQPQYQLRGIVSAIDPNAKTLVIGTKISAQAISYANVPAANLPSLAVGQFVLAVFQPPAQAGAPWNATALSISVPQPASGDSVTQEGTISAFTSAQSFSVDGLAVDASSASFPNGQTGLAVGARVSVIGTTTSQGVLTASSVTVEVDQVAGDANFELDGPITALSTAGTSFQVHGVTVSYASAQFQGGSVADLANGRKVQVLGGLSGDGTSIVATTITFLAS